MIINGIKIFASILLLGVVLSAMGASGQKINAEYERFPMNGDEIIHSGLAISPDGKSMAMAATKSSPLYIYDYANRAVITQFDIGNRNAGNRVSWSSGGRYLLLQELSWHEFSNSKDREVDFEIMDAGSGKSVLRFSQVQDVKISADENNAVVLNGNTIEFRSLPTGKVERSFAVQGDATGALCISPDGKYLAVSERPGEGFLKSDPQFRRNKKGLKFTRLYKQVVSVYRLSDFSLLTTIQEYYDNISRLDWSSDGRNIFCLNIPHLKVSTTVSGRQSFISVIDAVNFQGTRLVFPANSVYEPDFRVSHDGKSLAMVSWGKYPEIRVHDFATGQVMQRFEISTNTIKGFKITDFPLDGRIFIEFLPDDQSIIATVGNQLLVWRIPQE